MVGEIGASGQRYSPPQGRTTPEQFGAGIGSALRNLSQGVAQLEDSQADLARVEAVVGEQYAEKERKANRAKAQVELVRLRAELGRDLYTSRREAQEAGAGFTNNSHQEARNRADEFLQSLPVDIRKEFGAQVENVVQSATDQAFKFESELELDFFTAELEELSGSLSSAIDAGELSPDEAIVELGSILENTPIPQQEADRLFQQISNAFDESSLRREARLEAINPAFGAGTTGGPADGSDVVAAGLPGVARGLLNTIAGPESGGKYDIRFTSEGGTTFSDFSDHPRVFVPIVGGQFEAEGDVSSAAGRYQFTATTWDSINQELGLEDFSPRNQDVAAWALAQKDYKAKTGGRNLQADLASGDFRTIANARKILQRTWEGLKNLSDEEFFSGVTGSEGTPTALLTDERFASIPFLKRQQIIQDAANQALQLRIGEQQEFQALGAQLRDQLAFAINDGTAGFQQIEQLREAGHLTFPQYEGLVNQYETKNARAISSDRFANIAASGDFNPSNPEHRADAEIYYSEVGAAAVNSQDAAEFQKLVVPGVQASGYVSQALATDLARLSKGNADQAQFAFDALRTLQQTAPDSFAVTVPKETRADLAVYNQLAGFLPPQEVLQTLSDQRDPAKQIAFQQADAEIKEIRKENPRDFDPLQLIRREFGGGGGLFGGGVELPVDSSQTSAFISEFDSVYRNMYRRFRDHGKAHEATVEVMKQEWGVSNTGGKPNFMRYPPEKFASPLAGSFDYMDGQVREAAGLAAEQTFSLISDPQTEREITRYNFLRQVASQRELTEEEREAFRPPSYRVLVEDEFGNMEIAGMTYDEQGNIRIPRVFFDPEQSVKAAERDEQIDAVVTQQEMLADSRELQRLESLLPRARLARDEESVRGFQEEINRIRQRYVDVEIPNVGERSTVEIQLMQRLKGE